MTSRSVKVFRILIATVAIPLTSYLLYRWCWLPLDCNHRQAALEMRTLAAFEQKEAVSSKIIARDNLLLLRKCQEACPGDVNGFMLIAANDRILGLYDQARDAYEQALRLDRRPELYLQLGLIELQLHDAQAARQHVGMAVAFDPLCLDSITDGMLRSEVDALLQQEQAQRGNLVENPNFARSAAPGVRRDFDGIGKGSDSAAERWMLFNNSRGLTSTAMAILERNGSRHAVLHVTTSIPFSGILQMWAPAGTGPPHVRTSAWVFVRKGRVMLSSGDLGHGQLDAVSSATGRWQLLEGFNKSCPANHTRICSYDGAADFYVDAVSVLAERGAPCTRDR